MYTAYYHQSMDNLHKGSADIIHHSHTYTFVYSAKLKSALTHKPIDDFICVFEVDNFLKEIKKE